jgi:outer membrane protein OmpA-like peptidoglycan-associated protein
MFNLDGKDQKPLFDRLFSQAAKSWVIRGYITASVDPIVAKDDSFLRRIYQTYPTERIPDILPLPPLEIQTKPPFVTKAITVNFAPGSAVLDAVARKAIDDQVGLLPKIFPGVYIRVEGNTDITGNSSNNRGLSRIRAQAVVDYLVRKYRLPENQFIAVGNGSDKPVAANDTPAGRARNRRIDISLVAPKPPGLPAPPRPAPPRADARPPRRGPRSSAPG